MKNKAQFVLSGFGAFLIIAAVILYFIGVKTLNIEFIRNDLVPVAVGFLGLMLVIMSVTSIVENKNKTKAHIIEERDERNIVISQNAKAKAFDLMTILFALALLTLALLGSMNIVSFFTLVTIYLIGQIYSMYYHWLNSRRM